MAETDTPEIQIDKLGKFLVASRREYKDTKALLTAAQATIAAHEALGTNPNGETVKKFVDCSVAAGVAAASNELQQKVTALETQLATANAATADINTKFASAAVANEIREACRASHVKPEALDDAIAVGSTELKLIDGQVVTDDGRSAADWIEQRKSVSGYWWPAARGAGSRGSTEMPGVAFDNPFSKDSWNMTKQSQLALQDPARAARLQTEAAAMTRQ
jgi:hypothetical protein